MASIGFLVNALAFTGSNYLFSSLSKEAIVKESQERLDYINNKIMEERKAEKRFMDLNSAMQQNFMVTGRRLEPLPPKPVFLTFLFHPKITTIVN